MKIVSRTGTVILTAIFFAFCSSVQAQQQTKVPRIGYLAVVSLSSMSARIEPFRQGLRELGYDEGKNIFIEWRSADGNPDRMPTVANELVRLKVDIIVSASSISFNSCELPVWVEVPNTAHRGDLARLGIEALLLILLRSCERSVNTARDKSQTCYS